MDLSIDRMLLSEENGLIIDHNTLFMDDICQVMWYLMNCDDYAEHTREPEMRDHPYIPMKELTMVDPNIYFDWIYKIESADDIRKAVTTKGLETYIDPYEERSSLYLTDFGEYLRKPETKSGAIKWKIIKAAGNPFTMPGYESNTFEGDIYDYKKIADFIRDYNISIILIHNPELFKYIIEKTDIGNITFLYIAYNPNCELYHGTLSFKYFELFFDTIPDSRKIELCAIPPFEHKIDNYFRAYYEQVIKPMEENQNDANSVDSNK